MIYGNIIILEVIVDLSLEVLNIEWKKNDDIIKLDGRKFIINKLNKVKLILIIMCLDFDDSGDYVIFVINVLGFINVKICLNVKGIFRNIIYILSL